MIEGTCKKEKCPFFKEYGNECPFLVETWWHTNEGDKHLVEDCAPVRSMLMQQEYYNRAIALQKSHEESRNEQNKTNQKLDQTIEQTKSFMIEADKQMKHIKRMQIRGSRLVSDEELNCISMLIEDEENHEL